MISTLAFTTMRGLTDGDLFCFGVTVLTRFNFNSNQFNSEGTVFFW